MAENFSNNFSTTLAAGIDADDDPITVASSTGAPAANFRIKIDNEYLLVTAVSHPNWTVTRGIEGSTPATHSSGAPVTHVLTAGGLTQAMSENGGGITQEYLGYNTVGGTAETVTAYRQFLQKQTFAEGRLVASIDIYCKQSTAANAAGIAGFIYNDVGGKPKNMIAIGGDVNQALNLYRVAATTGDARWLSVPLGIWLPAGDYWYGGEVTTQAVYSFFYDATGTGHYWDKGGNAFYTDAPDTSGTVYTLQSHSRTYSFRLNTIR